MQEEVKKHTNKVFKELKSKHSISEKIKEIAIEIGIIVFAVTLSIWLHSWSEHSHQQDEVKEFLLDLKDDLKEDLQSLKEVNKSNIEQLKEMKFVNSLTSQKLDSLNSANQNVIFNPNINITKFNVGNYEGFKSSGKIGYIENKKLKKLILEYYQSYAPSIVELDIMNKELALKLYEDIFNNADKTGRVLFLDKKFQSKVNFFVQFSNGYVSGYDKVIKKAEELLKEISLNK